MSFNHARASSSSLQARTRKVSASQNGLCDYSNRIGEEGLEEELRRLLQRFVDSTDRTLFKLMRFCNDSLHESLETREDHLVWRARVGFENGERSCRLTVKQWILDEHDQ